MIEAYNLGSQVPNEEFIQKAVELKADVLLVSQTVTQKDVHIQNLTNLIELLEAEGLRDKFVVVCGGPRITHELAKEFNVRIPSFGHAGDGNLHVYICRDALDDTDWEITKKAVFDRMYEKSVQLGGLVSGEHGIGYAKKDYLRRQYGETPIALMQGIKKVFDEKNILNPGKVCF
mgnify:CR=1 FL=1